MTHRTLKDYIPDKWCDTEHGESYARIALRYGNPRLSQIDASWIERTLSKMSDLTPATRNRHAGILNTILKRAGSNCRIPKAPIVEPARRAFTDAERTAVDLWFKNNASVAHNAIYVILRDTGIRPGAEFRRIRRVDNNRIEVTSLKGGRIARTLTLTPEAFAAIHYPTGDYTGFTRTWNKMRQALFPNDLTVVPYTLRHTFAYRLLSAGIPLHVVSRLMGHTSIETTMQYVRLNPSDDIKALEALTR